MNISLENAERIAEECDFETMLYDHHLAREAGFKEKSENIWSLRDEIEGDILTYREYLENKKPLVEELE